MGRKNVSYPSLLMRSQFNQVARLGRRSSQSGMQSMMLTPKMSWSFLLLLGRKSISQSQRREEKMANQKKELKVTMGKKDEKKHSVKAYTEDTTQPFTNLYIDKAGMEELGNPTELEVIVRAKK